VSDFVSRMASRAVGQAASAQPRLPSLFEQSAPGGAPPEMVEETVAPRPPAMGGSQARSVALEPGNAVEQPIAAPRAVSTAPAPARPAGPDRTQSRARGEGADAARAAPGDARAGAESAEPAPAERGAEAPAQPVTRAAPVPAPPSIAPPAPEPSPVRVHIGRLEVRAAFPETPVPERTRERPRPPELSLGDYLRGRRAGS
jgi:hypothetical protein